MILSLSGESLAVMSGIPVFRLAFLSFEEAVLAEVAVGAKAGHVLQLTRKTHVAAM
jgi:hypothetical protein